MKTKKGSECCISDDKYIIKPFPVNIANILANLCLELFAVELFAVELFLILSGIFKSNL